MRLPTPCVYCGEPNVDVIRMLVECRPDDSGTMDPKSTHYVVRCPGCKREFETEAPAEKMPS